MIITQELDVEYPMIELLIPWYHLGQFTDHREVNGPDGTHNKHDYRLSVIWGGTFAYDDTLPGITEEEVHKAYSLLFGHCKDDWTGYNDWEPDQPVVHIEIFGSTWNDDGMGLRRLTEDEYKARCMEMLEILTKGMDEKATGDDSYFDYVPSEYDAMQMMARHLNEVWDTDEFLEPIRKVWDGIRGSGKEPIEFTDTYGERP